MSALEPINGVGLEQYAKICAKMTNSDPSDTEEHARIAATMGVAGPDWEAAKTGWTARMTSPEHAMEIQTVFMPAYQKAQAEERGGGEPCTLEQYVKAKAAMALKKDPADPTKQLDFQIVVAQAGFTMGQWGEIEGYWTPRIGSNTDERTKEFFNEAAAMKFRELFQIEADIIKGIVR